MNISFHEKSAWIMGGLLAIIGSWYARSVVSASLEAGEVVGPDIKLISLATAGLIIASIVSHVIVSVINAEDADDTVDERDSQILNKSGNISGYVLGVGVFAGLWHYFFQQDGNLLFHILVGSLILAQIADYALKIVFYRRAS